MVRGLNINGRGTTVQGRGVDIGEVGPDVQGWQTPSVARDDSRDGDAGKTVDDATSTYSVLDDSSKDEIEWSADYEYTQVRFDFNGTSGYIEVYLGDGTLIKDYWNVSGDPWYVLDLETETGGSITSTTQNYYVRKKSDGTNKRIAETDYYVP